jgi:small subunit ribosomal protein S4
MLKPIRDETGKNPLEREYKNYPPGMHMWRRGKTSDYAIRLREKQKVKRHYGMCSKSSSAATSRRPRACRATPA